MKKAGIIIFSFFVLIIFSVFIAIKLYSRNLNNRLFEKEEKIRPVWKDLLNRTNTRIRIIDDLYKNYNCDHNKHLKTFDSIFHQKKASEEYMKKNFHALEFKANIILLDLYNCKGEDKNELDLAVKSYNDSLSVKVKEYNNLVSDYNNEIFNLLNSFFIDHDKYISKRYLKIDYLNDIRQEVKKQSEVENWIETGILPNK